MATNWCIQKGVICDRVAASGYCAQSACTKVFQTGTARQTNAGRIRAMSDEELADMFAEFAEENPSDDASAWYEWLTKPAEVE